MISVSTLRHYKDKIQLNIYQQEKKKTTQSNLNGNMKSIKQQKRENQGKLKDAYLTISIKNSSNQINQNKKQKKNTISKIMREMISLHILQIIKVQVNIMNNFKPIFQTWIKWNVH